jgi:putative molybdopterin biosynthesis protein
MGGVAAARARRMRSCAGASRRSASGVYNAHLLRAGSALVKGWQRMQGFVHRRDDARFAGTQRSRRAQRPRSPIRDA